jgi:hypothetical protein
MKTLFGFFQRRSGLPFLATAALTALTSATSWGQTNPSLFNLGTGNYSLTSWASTSTAATYPANMVFHRTGTQDPGLAVATTTDYTGAYNGTSGARINGLDADGFSFVNTSSSGNLGAAVLGLDTTGRQNIVVGWTGGLVAQADSGRVYAIRLQYRVGTGGTWTDVSPTSEYSSSGLTAGHSSSFTATLPAECNDQPSVYVRWKYLSASGSSGSRPRLRVDEISVSSSSAAPPVIVNLTTPAAASRYLPGATVPLTATASQTGGTISKVEFFEGSNKLGEDTSEPFTFDWTAASAGTYSLTAVATGSLGGTATSSAVSVSILPTTWTLVENFSGLNTTLALSGQNGWASGTTSGNVTQDPADAANLVGVLQAGNQIANYKSLAVAGPNQTATLFQQRRKRGLHGDFRCRHALDVRELPHPVWHQPGLQHVE